jgi:biopolymer transport protein ExbB
MAGEDTGGSFDVNQTAAFHFSGQNNIVIDSSAYGQKATLVNVERMPASLIGAGIKLNGESHIDIQPSPSLQYLAGKGFAFSSWIKAQGSQNDSWIVSHQTTVGKLILGIDQSNLYARWEDANGGIIQTPATAPLTLDSWQHIGLNLDDKRLAVFVNGIEMASVQITIPNFIAGELSIGGAKNHGFMGEMDEISLSGIARNPDWFSLKTTTQGQQANLLALTESEQLGGSSDTSYFAAILQGVSLDGWIVIGMLMMMSAISWMVMVAKTMMLNRMQKDNLSFTKDFHSSKTEEDPGILDAANDDDFDGSFVNTMFGKHDHYQSSPLYHVYHQGVQELNQRIGHSVGASANNALTPQAVSAIRAALDASLVREAQKLNGKMVLLTIAIAGGPFLGLLGTVLGVMITFAAIAMSGTVDINAIAPGVSAALMTTVAGLFVAIPALFGYNYLSVRIKDMLSDMHVFVDEFIAKIAEHHC